MKKVLLAVLCAGLFFACGKKKQVEQTEPVVDTTVVEEVIEEAEEVVADVVAEEPEVAQTPAKKTNTASAKKTNNSGMTATKTNETQSVKEHAESAGNRVANKAIDKAESEATTTIVNSGKKKR